MTIVRAIMNALRTHWIWVTSACRWVIMVGTATFTEPIMIEFVNEPRIIDRLIAQRAADTLAPGNATGLAAAAKARYLADECGGLATGCLSCGGEPASPRWRTGARAQHLLL